MDCAGDHGIVRIAIVAESFLPNVNGVTNSVLRVLEYLRRNGHEALVIAPDTPSGQAPAPTVHDGTPVHRVPALFVPKIASLPVGVPQPSIVRVLRDFEPDVVHLASPFVLGGAGLAAANFLGIPSVAVFQTDVAGFAGSYGLALAERAAWIWTRVLHNRANRTLAPSSWAAEALDQHGIERVHRWARGVDSVRFFPGERDEDLRAQWSPEGRLIVGFVGRLAPEKHVERLACLNRDKRVQIVIVGDGPERARLERLMPNAVFTGELGGRDLAKAYASLDVFVHTGEHETFCQAVQEALSSGVPVIAPDMGGPRDLVAHLRNGYLLPVDRFTKLLPGTIESLRDSEVRARFGEAARKSVMPRTWPALCAELMSHYTEVVGSGRTLAAI